MNILDAAILIFCAIFALSTYKMGFLNLLRNFIFFLAASAMGFFLLEPILNFLNKYGWKENLYTPVFLFPILTILFWGVLTAAFSKSLFRFKKPFDNILNIIVGLFFGFVVASYLILIFGVFGQSDSFVKVTGQSFGLKNVHKIGIVKVVEDGLLTPINKEIARSAIISNSNNEVLNLDITISSSTYSPELSKKMLDLTNAERQNAGLEILQKDPVLDQVASQYATEIILTKRFSHLDKFGLLPIDRAKNYSVSFTYIGENLALAETVEAAHQGLMDSLAHRENIESPIFRKVGIAVYDLSPSGKLVVEEFTN